jgi:hypothetical protein
MWLEKLYKCLTYQGSAHGLMNLLLVWAGSRRIGRRVQAIGIGVGRLGIVGGAEAEEDSANI